jgi:hypothetical protein
VAAVQVCQSFHGQCPEPRIERQRPLAQIPVQFFVGLREHVLHDIGGIYAWGEPTIEAVGDHFAESFAVAHQEPFAGRAVTLGRLAQQVIGVRLGRSHESPLYSCILQLGRKKGHCRGKSWRVITAELRTKS